MSGTKKILFANHVGHIGGAEKSLIDLIKHLPQRDYEVSLLAPSGPLTDLAAPYCKSTYTFNFKSYSRMNFPLYACNTCRFMNYLHRFDAVHSNSLKVYMDLFFATMMMRKKHIAHIRDIIKPKINRVMMLNRAARVVANSEAARDNLVKIGVEPERIDVIYNAVNMDNYATRQEMPDELRTRFNISRRSRVIAFVGQLCKRKAVDILLRAFALIQDRVDACLVIAGEDNETGGEYLHYLQDLALELKIKRIIFTGFLHDIPGLMSSIDILVLPSLEEPFGRVLIEAMAAGKPVLASSVGGIPEIVDHGENGLLFEKGDMETLSNYLREMSTLPEKYADFGEKGRMKVQEYFSIDAQIRNIAELYSGILER